MENIKIIDNYFDDENITKIKNYIQTQLYVCKCFNNHNSEYNNDIPYWRIELSENEYFSIYLKKIIMENEKIHQDEYNFNRVYLIAQSYEQHSNYHTDTQNGITVCLYLNELTSDESCGDFYVRIPNKNQIYTIEPKNNRIVIFPANYIHKGSGFSNENLRKCVTWKFEKKKYLS